MPVIRRIALFSCLLLLAGCVSPLQKLQKLNPSGADYNSELASEYLSYAQSESEQGRKWVAEKYGEKGLKALQGENVEPSPVDTSLPPEDQEELTAARMELMALLTPGMKEEAPQALARAQLLFDCWQHEVKRRINQELAPCQEEFQASLSELQDISDSLIYANETEYTLHFAKGRGRLTASDHHIIQHIAEEVKNHSSYLIEIAALDTVAHERKLAAMRISSVYKALVKMGLADKNIRVKKEADNKKVYLSCDVSPGNNGTVTVTVKTSEGEGK